MQYIRKLLDRAILHLKPCNIHPQVEITVRVGHLFVRIEQEIHPHERSDVIWRQIDHLLPLLLVAQRQTAVYSVVRLVPSPSVTFRS